MAKKKKPKKTQKNNNIKLKMSEISSNFKLFFSKEILGFLKQTLPMDLILEASIEYPVILEEILKKDADYRNELKQNLIHIFILSLEKDKIESLLETIENGQVKLLDTKDSLNLYPLDYAKIYCEDLIPFMEGVGFKNSNENIEGEKYKVIAKSLLEKTSQKAKVNISQFTPLIEDYIALIFSSDDEASKYKKKFLNTYKESKSTLQGFIFGAFSRIYLMFYNNSDLDDKLRYFFKNASYIDQSVATKLCFYSDISNLCIKNMQYKFAEDFLKPILEDFTWQDKAKYERTRNAIYYNYIQACLSQRKKPKIETMSWARERELCSNLVYGKIN